MHQIRDSPAASGEDYGGAGPWQNLWLVGGLHWSRGKVGGGRRGRGELLWTGHKFHSPFLCAAQGWRGVWTGGVKLSLGNREALRKVVLVFCLFLTILFYFYLAMSLIRFPQVKSVTGK